MSEQRRLEALRSLGLLDAQPDAHYDRITRLARSFFGVPIALVTFVDEERQWFKSHPGTELTGTSREIAFCEHFTSADDILEVPDARRDPRFADNVLVTGEPGVRFYAACAVKARDGTRIGSVTIVDMKERSLTRAERDVLRDLAALVEREVASLHVAALDRLPIGMYRATADGHLLDANPAMVAMLGYPDREALLQCSWRDLHADPHDRERLLALADREGSVQGMETQVRRRDGERLWVRLNVFRERKPDGQTLYYAGTIEDVTERKLAEEALWESEARLKLLLEQIPAVLWTTDRDLRSTLSQGAALASIGLRPNELAGKTLYEYMQTDDPDFPTIAAHRRALAGEFVSFRRSGPAAASRPTCARCATPRAPSWAPWAWRSTSPGSSRRRRSARRRCA